MVMAEFEPYADVILVEYGVAPAAVLDVLTGAFEPQDPASASDAERYEDGRVPEGRCGIRYGMLCGQ